MLLGRSELGSLGGGDCVGALGVVFLAVIREELVEGCVCWVSRYTALSCSMGGVGLLRVLCRCFVPANKNSPAAFANELFAIQNKIK